MKEFVYCKTYNTAYSKNEDCHVEPEKISDSADVAPKTSDSVVNQTTNQKNESNFEVDLTGVMSKYVVFRMSIFNNNQV